MNQCLNCGKLVSKNKEFCNSLCKDNYFLFTNKEKLEFYSYVQASKYFNKDSRTIKNFENILFTINRNLPNPNIRYVICKICEQKSISSECRAGYCKICRANGKGKKEQAKIISEKYKGIGNPNYLNGNSKSTDYTESRWKSVKKELKFTECAISGLKENIDYHHIIPRWFCNLVGIDVYDKTNIIGINHEYHKAIHHLQLDILLLPNLYPLHKKDALQLHEEFVRLLKFHKVHEFPVEKLQSLNLFQISKYQGKKKLLHLLPEFLPPFFDHKV